MCKAGPDESKIYACTKGKNPKPKGEGGRPQPSLECKRSKCGER